MNFGRIKYAPDPDGGTKAVWAIVCEPHIRARLKRVFPRAPQHAADHIAISSSPENARDILWFLDRYPMEVDRLDLLKELATRHRNRADRLEALLPPEKEGA